MNLIIIIFNQFKQFQKLSSDLNLVISSKSDLPSQVEVSDHVVKLFSLGDYFLAMADVELLFSTNNINLYNYCTSGQALILSMESTTGMLSFEFFDNGKKVREWREVEGEVLNDFGHHLNYEPKGVFTSESDEDGERDEWQLISIAEKYCGIDWDDWGH